jgi:hypothetical protein
METLQDLAFANIAKALGMTPEELKLKQRDQLRLWNKHWRTSHGIEAGRIEEATKAMVVDRDVVFAPKEFPEGTPKYLYMEANTGILIPHEEYERRYMGHVADTRRRKDALKMDVHVPHESTSWWLEKE